MLEVENLYSELIETSDKLNEVCKTLNEDYQEVMTKNDFFKLYCYNEYVNDIFKTNKTIHYQQILKNANFKLIDEYIKPTKFNKDQLDELKDNREQVYADLFDEYIDKPKDRTKIKFEIINNNIKVLNLPTTNEILIKYKEYITNTFKLNDHMNIIRILKSNDYIKTKLNKITANNQKVKVLDNIYNKINILRKLEQSLFLKPLQVNYSLIDNIDIIDKEWTLIKNYLEQQKTNHLIW